VRTCLYIKAGLGAVLKSLNLGKAFAFVPRKEWKNCITKLINNYC